MECIRIQSLTNKWKNTVGGGYRKEVVGTQCYYRHHHRICTLQRLLQRCDIRANVLNGNVVKQNEKEAVQDEKEEIHCVPHNVSDLDINLGHTWNAKKTFEGEPIPGWMTWMGVMLAVFVGQCLPASATVMSIDPTLPGFVGDSPFNAGFISAFLLIFFSEIGDKTFFIALLLALQRPKSVVFTGTFGALAVMTVISVALGRVLHELDELIPDVGFPIDDALAVALLVFFGIQTLANAAEADETAEEEKEEAEEVVAGMSADYKSIGLILSTFTLVFAAEWGDKSFLATIALAAASDPVGVIGGAVTGHGVASGIAVLGGSFLSKYMSEKTVQYVGGTLFLVFAAITLFEILN